MVGGPLTFERFQRGLGVAQLLLRGGDPCLMLGQGVDPRGLLEKRFVDLDSRRLFAERAAPAANSLQPQRVTAVALSQRVQPGNRVRRKIAERLAGQPFVERRFRLRYHLSSSDSAQIDDARFAV